MATSAAGIKQLVKQWQKRLRLQDWRLRVVVLSESDMKQFLKENGRPADYICGATAIRQHEKSATVYLTNMSPSNRKLNDPLEVTVIHELLHLHFVTDDEEPAIDSIAWALFKARNPKAKDQYANV